MWLIWTHWATFCAERQTCAKDLLLLGAKALGATGSKFVVLFKAEITYAARTGLLHEELWHCLFNVALEWRVDTQDAPHL